MVLRLGQRVPPFSLPDSEGKTRTLKEFTDRGRVIIAFFPFAFSGTCDREMCTLRDDFTSSLGEKVRVLGVSVDSTYTLRVFSQTYNLSFPLLSDFNKRVAKLYGILETRWGGQGFQGVAKRAVFLVDGRGKLRYRWISSIPADEPPYSELMRRVRDLEE